MNINQNRKTMIIVLTIIVTMALSLVLIITPLVKTLVFDSTMLALERQKIDNLSKQASDIKDSEAFYRAQSENIKKINKIFIDAAAPIDFMSSLEDSADLSGVIIEVSSSSSLSSKIKKLSNTESIDFQLTIEGPAVDCLEFLNRLENNPYLVSIRSINIVRADSPDITKNLSEAVIIPTSEVKATIVISVFMNNNQ
ncbi:MAG: hypothetical protein V1905_00450 [bacterium]